MSKVFLLVCLAIVLAGSWWYLDDGFQTASFDLPQFPTVSFSTCEATQPEFLSGDVFPLEREVILASNRTVRFLVCQAGVLEFLARGSLFDNFGAYMIVTSGIETLWAGEVREELMSFYLEVPEASWLTISFTNDAYAPPQDRNLWLSDLVYKPLP